MFVVGLQVKKMALSGDLNGECRVLTCLEEHWACKTPTTSEISSRNCCVGSGEGFSQFHSRSAGFFGQVVRLHHQTGLTHPIPLVGLGTQTLLLPIAIVFNELGKTFEFLGESRLSRGLFRRPTGCEVESWNWEQGEDFQWRRFVRSWMLAA